ncbi:hypothetical protein FQZ97_1020770 [compost metagenome]
MGRREEDGHQLRGTRCEPRVPPLRAHHRQVHPLRPGRHQGHGPAGHRRHRGGARRSRRRPQRCRDRPVQEPVRFLPPGGPPAPEQAHGGSADQGRGLRLAAPEPRRGAGLGGGGVRLRRCQRGQRQPGRPVRHDGRGRPRLQHAGARPGVHHALGCERALDAGEDCPRLLFLGPSV